MPGVARPALRAARKDPTGFVPVFCALSSERYFSNGVIEWYMANVRGTRKLDIPSPLTDAFEQAGTATVEALLFQGWVNREGLPEELKRISDQPEIRNHALAWLQSKKS